MNTTEIQNTTVKNLLIAQIEQTFKAGARFIGLTYTNQNGGTSRYNLLTGVNLTSLYKSDLRSLLALRPDLTGVQLEACDEIIASIKNSLEKGIGNNDNYTLKGYFTPVTANGEVKLHTDDTGATHLYLRGYVIKKTELVKGTYKPVKSSPKTLAKKELEKNLRRGDLRTFKINVEQIHGISMNGMTVELS